MQEFLGDYEPPTLEGESRLTVTGSAILLEKIKDVAALRISLLQELILIR